VLLAIWLGPLASTTQERQLAARLQASVAPRLPGADCGAQGGSAVAERQRRRSLARPPRELCRIRLRDYFPPAERELAQRAVGELAAALKEVVSWGGRRAGTATSTERRAPGSSADSSIRTPSLRRRTRRGPGRLDAVPQARRRALARPPPTTASRSSLTYELDDPCAL